MNNAAQSAPRKVVPDEPTTPNDTSPTVQVIALSELEVRRPEELDPLASGGARAVPLVDALADLHHPLRRVKAKLTVSVGTAEISIGDLLGAREQQLLRLDRTVEQPVDVLLEGQVVARGILVAADDHFAVRITDLPAAFDPGTNASGEA